MFQCVECAAHGENCKGMVFASMVFQPGRILEHRKPPFLQYPFHSAPNISRTDGVDQRSWIWSSQHNAMLSNHVTLNDPVTAAFVQVKFSFVDGRTGCAARVMAADVAFWNIRAFQFRRPFWSALPNAVMHGFQLSDRFI